MKVLIINLDKGIFIPGSKSLERLKEYAGFCEKLSVVVLTRQPFEPIIAGNLSIFATASCCRVKYSFDALALAKKIMKEERHDLVMTQDPFDTGHIGWLIKKRYKIPWQCQIHTDFLSPYFWRESFLNKFRVFLAKFLLPKADGIRVVSERIKKSLVARDYFQEPIVVLPIFVDVTKIKNAPIKTNLKQKYPQFDFIILIASRLSKEKNIGLAIDAVEEVVKKYPKTGLIVVGSGLQEQNLKFKIENLKLHKNVVLESWSDDLASYYKTADLFLLISNYEGWGMTVVEAMACACPVIMTDVGCAGELVNNENGLIVPCEDKKSLVLAIEKLREDESFRKKIGEAAENTVLSLPDREQNLDLYKKSFSNLIS